MAYGRATVRVVGKLGKVKKTYPVVLLSGDIVTKTLLKHSVNPLGLAVGLRVEGGGEVELSTKQCEERRPESPSEMRVAVRDDTPWKPPQFDNLPQE